MIQGENTLSWKEAHRRIGAAVLEHQDDHEDLVDRLSFALEQSFTPFPIIETGEILADIDPFTFFASWCRPMDDQRRNRLVHLVADALDVQLEGSIDFDGLPLVEDRQARFFGRNVSLVARDIRVLWEVYRAVREEGRESEAAAAAFSSVERLRMPGRLVLKQAVQWIDPNFAESRDAVSRYRRWGVDSDNVMMLLKAYARHLDRFGRSRDTWRAVQSFQVNWDENAEDFEGMLRRALADSAHLLSKGFNFSALKEIMLFAKREPETLRRAFLDLYDTRYAEAERICRFEAELARLFETYRADLVHSFARRSSHGNYHANSIYLFLRYPDESYLFSPRRMRALAKAAGWAKPYRIAHPDVVGDYHELCDAVLPIIEEQAGILGLELGSGAPEEYADPCHHLLLEDVALFACEYPDQSFSNI